MIELFGRRVVASQKVGVRLYFSQIDLVILILVPVRRNDQPLVLQDGGYRYVPVHIPVSYLRRTCDY